MLRSLPGITLAILLASGLSVGVEGADKGRGKDPPGGRRDRDPKADRRDPSPKPDRSDRGTNPGPGSKKDPAFKDRTPKTEPKSGPGPRKDATPVRPAAESKRMTPGQKMAPIVREFERVISGTPLGAILNAAFKAEPLGKDDQPFPGR
jgi:hypothetical protein